MAISVGARLGSCNIEAAIGAGGMGEVYRVTDTNLGRQVAIKVRGSVSEKSEDSWWVAADGSGTIERLTTSDVQDAATGITPDGRSVIFTRIFGAGNREIWSVPLDGERTPMPLIQGGEFTRGNGEVCPAGSALAYSSDQSGQAEIYVQPYPGPGPMVPVSIGGGHAVTWSSDGSELFYLNDQRMFSVPVRNEGGSIKVGTPTRVLQTAARPRVRRHVCDKE